MADTILETVIYWILLGVLLVLVGAYRLGAAILERIQGWDI